MICCHATSRMARYNTDKQLAGTVLTSGWPSASLCDGAEKPCAVVSAHTWHHYAPRSG